MIYFSGHFDHLGMGGPGSSSLAGDTVAVHYGADNHQGKYDARACGKFALKGSHKEV
jgi:hypothetical protein